MTRRSSRFIVSLSLAGIFHLGILWGIVIVWDNEDDSIERISKPQTVEVSYVNSDQLMRSFELFDPRPLLIPTEWNFATTERLEEVLQEEKQIFADYDPMYRSEAGDFVSTFGDRWEGIDSYQDLQSRFGEELFRGLSSVREKKPEALGQSIEVSVFRPATGERVFRKVYYINAAEDLANAWPDWRPARFLASVEKSFLVTRMNVLESSGYQEVDEKLERLLASQLIGKGLFEDGPYLVEVGP